MRLPISGKYFNLKVFIDKKDWNCVKKYTWWICCKKCGYMQVYTQINRKTVILSRFLLGAPFGLQVDHINRNPLDNRRKNLRLCTLRQNSFNVGIKKSNKSGYSGIDFRKDRKKWRATIRIDGIKKSLGHFDTIKEAVSARKKAEKKYYKEFAPKYR